MARGAGFQHSMVNAKLDNLAITRIEKFVSNDHFADSNLLSVLYNSNYKCNVSISMFSVPGGERISFADAITYDFVPVTVGHSFGPIWSYHWFKIDISDISVISSSECLEFHWNCECEGEIWLPDGRPLQGLTSGREEVSIHSLIHNGRCTFYIEVCCISMLGNGSQSLISPPTDRSFTLRTATVKERNDEVFELLKYCKLIIQMLKVLPKECLEFQRTLAVGNWIVDICWPDISPSVKMAICIARQFFSATKKEKPKFTVSAVGHCHIDTAWLWRFKETRAKCLRSWTSQLALMDKYPYFVFACSQAQQMDWLKSDHPQIFEKIKKKAASGQFVPIGGSWVEMDCNIPSGESMARQLIYGQEFFQDNFGFRSQVFWLPDTFGYSPQIPQLMFLCGLKYFLTQKISWNSVNTFPYSSFMWQGIDGSSVLTHFPPANTYNSQGNAADILHSVNMDKECGISSDSLLLYGNGDGGGGPTMEMIENLELAKSAPFLPNIEFENPVEFYKRLENDVSKLPQWVGELYLELHQGTFTSQAFCKKNNRICENLLRQVEFVFVMLYLLSNGHHAYPKAEIERLWKLLLLTQFHDVLPGSSITDVYVDAKEVYDDIIVSSRKLLDGAWHEMSVKAIEHAVKHSVLNLSDCPIQHRWEDNGTWKIAEIPPFSIGMPRLFKQISNPPPIQYSSGDDFDVVENCHMICKFNESGHIVSLIHKGTGNECIGKCGFGNELWIHEDIPPFWDAWDIASYHLRKKQLVTLERRYVQLLDDGSVHLIFEGKISPNSSIHQMIILEPEAKILKFRTSVDWNESRKILKVTFPLSVQTSSATFDTQFGLVSRPTHTNTTWDIARFEVPAQSFVDLSEHGFGVAVVADYKHGFCVTNGAVVGISLLRSPKAPDPECDMGLHEFTYGIMPHRDRCPTSEMIRDLRIFKNNLFVTIEETLPMLESLISMTPLGSLALDGVKMSQDGSGIVLRFYESCGGRGTAEILFSKLLESKIAKISLCNLLEDDMEDLTLPCRISYRPFQILSLFLKLKK